MNGISETWTNAHRSRPISLRSCRIASRNGRDSMSPTVPPISTIWRSACSASASASTRALISSVMCGITCTVLPEVVAAALLREDRAVHRAGREVRPPVQVGVEEPLVVPEVQVGLGAVVEDEHLAVLERVHRPGVDVDVRVELLEDDLETAGGEEAAEGGGGDPLAETGGDTARDEDVLRVAPSPREPTVADAAAHSVISRSPIGDRAADVTRTPASARTRAASREQLLGVRERHARRPPAPRASGRAPRRRSASSSTSTEAVAAVLAHPDVAVREAGDLRQVRHHEHLAGRRRAGPGAARRRARPRRRSPRRPRRTRASGRRRGRPATLRHASMTRESSPPLAAFASGSDGCPAPPENRSSTRSAPDGPARRSAVDGELDSGAGHPQLLELGGRARPPAAGAASAAGLGAARRPRGRHARPRPPRPRPRASAEPLVGRRERRELVAAPVEEREHLGVGRPVLALQALRRRDALADLLEPLRVDARAPRGRRGRRAPSSAPRPRGAARAASAAAPGIEVGGGSRDRAPPSPSASAAPPSSAPAPRRRSRQLRAAARRARAAPPRPRAPRSRPAAGRPPRSRGPGTRAGRSRAPGRGRPRCSASSSRRARRRRAYALAVGRDGSRWPARRTGRGTRSGCAPSSSRRDWCCPWISTSAAPRSASAAAVASWPPIRARLRPSAPTRPRQDDLAVLGPLLGPGGRVEPRLDLGRRRARADELRARRAAERERDADRDHRLAGAGLAGEDGEPGCGLEVELVDHAETGDVQLRGARAHPSAGRRHRRASRRSSSGRPGRSNFSRTRARNAAASGRRTNRAGRSDAPDPHRAPRPAAPCVVAPVGRHQPGLVADDLERDHLARRRARTSDRTPCGAAIGGHDQALDRRATRSAPAPRTSRRSSPSASPR